MFTKIIESIIWVIAMFISFVINTIIFGFLPWFLILALFKFLKSKKKFLIVIIFFIPILFRIGPFLLIAFLIWNVYEYFYYKSEKFKRIKKELSDYVKGCHELNEHIENLKESYFNIKKSNYGRAEIKDRSKYRYKSSKQIYEKSKFIFECSAPVFRNAERQPFKYLCKYFNIELTEKSLEIFEDLLNKFSAAEDGKILLNNELERIKESIKIRKDIPFLIRKFGMRKFAFKMGIIQKVDFSTLYFPVYTFKYVSPGGNKSMICDIKLDIDNLNDFVEYLSRVISFRKSAAGQRALMTSKLRELIKKRDNYTCKQCGLSTYDEPNLLLEIDHIVPISKGGLSVEENLQTLCWKCNRTKGDKLIT